MLPAFSSASWAASLLRGKRGLRRCLLCGKGSADEKVILLQQSLLTYGRELIVVCVHFLLTVIDVI